MRSWCWRGVPNNRKIKEKGKKDIVGDFSSPALSLLLCGADLKEKKEKKRDSHQFSHLRPRIGVHAYLFSFLSLMRSRRIRSYNGGAVGTYVVWPCGVSA